MLILLKVAWSSRSVLPQLRFPDVGYSTSEVYGPLRGSPDDTKSQLPLQITLILFTIHLWLCARPGSANSQLPPGLFCDERAQYIAFSL